MLGSVEWWLICLIAIEVIGCLYGTFLTARSNINGYDLFEDCFNTVFFFVLNIFAWPVIIAVYYLRRHNRTRKY